jgi:hypothetical protein
MSALVVSLVQHPAISAQRTTTRRKKERKGHGILFADAGFGKAFTKRHVIRRPSLLKRKTGGKYLSCL